MATVSVVTYEALQLLTAWLITSANKYISWGTNGSTAVRADTALGTEAYSNQNDGSGHATRVAGTQAQATISQTNDTYTVQGTLTVRAGEGPISITESGVFDSLGTSAGLTTAPSGGNMSLMSSFSALPLNDADAIQFTHKLQFT